MAKTLRAQVLVVGGGPGGYVAAIRAGQLGLDTILVEGERLGGTCLIRGCIPSKALIHAADRFAGVAAAAGDNALGIGIAVPPTLDFAKTVAWKDGIVDRLNAGVATLLLRAKVRALHGWAVFSDAKTCSVETRDGSLTITAEHVILATGSETTPLPGLPFGGAVISSTEALSLPEVPNHLAVVGAGYIGLELGTAFRKFGSTVTVIEAEDRILPRYDAQLTAPVRRWLERAGVTLHLGARVTGFDNEGGLLVALKDGGQTSVPADKILVTVGRRPRTEGWGIGAMNLDLDRGIVKIDDQCRTAVRNVWAIGDFVGEPMLAHRAMAQGAMVAEIIAGARRHFTPAAIPAICFTDPEIVMVGLSPEEAVATGEDTDTAIFPFSANGRALTLQADEDSGFVRIVFRRTDQRIVGIQAVGGHIAELAGEFAHALEMGALVDDVAGTIHAHPTLGEAFAEAAFMGLGRGLHV
jgi:dihydrolipoamide dehydrogenase